MNIQFNPPNPPASIKQIEELENMIGHTLPNDYKEFLLTTNGGRPTKTEKLTCAVDWKGIDWAANDSKLGIHFIYKFENDVMSALDLAFAYDTFVQEDLRIPKNTMPIAHDAGANQYIMSLNADDYGHVYYWLMDLEKDPDDESDPSYENVVHVAKSFTDFLNCFSIDK